MVSTEIIVILVLVLLNGFFALSEMALVTSRKSRLKQMGPHSAGARKACTPQRSRLARSSPMWPMLGLLTLLVGAFGGESMGEKIHFWLQSLGAPERAASITATALVVTVITFITIVFGELVPKRIGQLYPETVARLVAPSMNLVSVGARPLVRLLSVSTEATLRLLGLSNKAQRGVTEEEIAASLEEGLDAGVIEEHEHQMVRNVFRLDERQIGSMMIPRAEIAWLDVEDTAEAVLKMLQAHGYSRYPVCRGGLDDVLGIATAQGLLARVLAGQDLALGEDLEPPVFVPETLSGMELLEHFRASNAPLVFVVDEYGEVQGVISVRDVLEAIAGEFNAPGDGDAWAVQREDGSWLMDGLIPVPELKDRLGLKELPEEDRGRYNTLAGMVMLLLGRLPRTADVVEWNAWRFEVVDLDGKRVDKVLVSRLAEDGEKE